MEKIIVLAIVVVSILLLLRHLVGIFKGKGSCCGGKSCENCNIGKKTLVEY